MDITMSTEEEPNMHKIPHIFSLIFSEIPTYIYMFDIFVGLFTAYYEKGILIKNQRRIIRNYFYNNMFWDILAISPYFISFFVYSRYIGLILMFRIT